jgi:uncharacterized protein with NRDE domain
MCLILLAWDSHPDYSLIVAANRDEFYDRPTTPAAFWTDAPSVLGGRDLRAGGTWLGIDHGGRFAAVTNYRQGQREPAAAQSRGRLVSDFLTTQVHPQAYIDQVEQEAERYNGFNLIVGDPRELVYFSNREGIARTLKPGVYGLSNHLLDSPWPKVTSGKTALSALIQRGGPRLITDLFELLSDRSQPADELLPETGIGREWERLLAAAFISSEEYGTRSSTVLLVGRKGQVIFAERGFGPRGKPGEPVRFEFALR